jgi:hypothetical protein
MNPIEYLVCTHVLRKGINSYFVSGTRRIKLVTNPVISHEWLKDWLMNTTNRTYPCMFVFAKVLDLPNMSYSIYICVSHIVHTRLRIYPVCRIVIIGFKTNPVCHIVFMRFKTNPICRIVSINVMTYSIYYILPHEVQDIPSLLYSINVCASHIVSMRF